MNKKTDNAPEMVLKFAQLLRLKTNHPDTPRYVQSRLAGLGLGKTCGRCGGCGEYSYNQIDGTVCYGCGGTGKVAQKLTEALYVETKALVDTGKLDDYLAVRRQIRALKEVKYRIKGFNDARHIGDLLYTASEGLHIRLRYNDNRPDLNDSLTSLVLELGKGLHPLCNAAREAYSKALYTRTSAAKQGELTKEFWRIYGNFARAYNTAIATVKAHPDFNLGERCYNQEWIVDFLAQGLPDKPA